MLPQLTRYGLDLKFCLSVSDSREILKALKPSFEEAFSIRTKEEAIEYISRYVKLNFKNTKIYLNPKELNLAVKLQNPKILVKDNEIVLSKSRLLFNTTPPSYPKVSKVEKPSDWEFSGIPS